MGLGNGVNHHKFQGGTVNAMKSNTMGRGGREYKGFGGKRGGGGAGNGRETTSSPLVEVLKNLKRQSFGGIVCFEGN